LVELEHEKQEKGAVRVPPGGGGRALWVCGELVTFKVRGKQTGGAYSLFEVATRPGGGQPPHVQHWEDEAVYVLEGEYEFYVEGDATIANPGSLVFVPRGRLHAYTNVGNEPGRVLAVHTPGGPHERFFEEIGGRGDVSGPTVGGAPAAFGVLAEVAARYGIEIPRTEE
jgi:quercetin dioxygenase-like cupin family protein